MITWLDKEIAFYDFIWEKGTEICGKCVNAELMQDFAQGGNQFELMKKAILKEFPTRESAESVFNSPK